MRMPQFLVAMEANATPAMAHLLHITEKKKKKKQFCCPLLLRKRTFSYFLSESIEYISIATSKLEFVF